MPGVGENPGQMRAVRSGDLAALVSDVDLSGRLGSPDDFKIHREIPDASAPEVPVLALPFGTVLTSEEEVAEKLLAAHHDEFTKALKELEGRTQFVVQGRYLERAFTTSREEDTRAWEKAQEGHCAASIARKPPHELDAVRVAFLVDDQEGEAEWVIEALAREWDGRIQLQLLGTMAPYDLWRPRKWKADTRLVLASLAIQLMPLPDISNRFPQPRASCRLILERPLYPAAVSDCLGR